MLKQLLLVIFFACCYAPLLAQQDTAGKQLPDTTVPLTVVQKVQQIAKEKAAEGSKKFQATLENRRQEELLEVVRATTLKARDYVKARLDTNGINKDLREIAKLYSIAGDGVFTNTGSAQTYRNLTTTYKILYELSVRAGVRKNQVDNYHKNLHNFRFEIDSLQADSLLYKFPTDSAELVRYSRRYSYIAIEMDRADSALEKAIVSTEELQVKTNALVYTINTGMEQVEEFQYVLSGKTFSREFSNIWHEPAFARPFKEIIHFSASKARLSFWFYVIDNPGKLLILLALIFTAGFFLLSLKKKLQEENRLTDDNEGQLVFRYPVLSAIMIILNIFQFIFPAPPFVFSCVLWGYLQYLPGNYFQEFYQHLLDEVLAIEYHIVLCMLCR